MVCRVFLLSRIALAICARSSPNRAMSAASMAASLPITPMAMPTSAIARAGASLIPSPIIATLYALFKRLTAFTLSSGNWSAANSSIPAIKAIASAVRGLSPVSITIFFKPISFKEAIARLAPSRNTSATLITPRKWLSSASSKHVSPFDSSRVRYSSASGGKAI